MDILKEPNRDTSSQRALTTVVVIAVLAVVLSIWAVTQSYRSSLSGQGTQGTTAKTSASLFPGGEMRVGYGGFPPYTITTPNGGDPTGFSVDLVKAIAAQYDPPLKVKWVLFNWDTLKADMQSKKFDFIADPTFATVPRAADFGISMPYSYFGIACAIVRKDDTRFKTFEDLDRSDITIALAEGWTSSDYAKAHLTKPKFKAIPVQGDATAQLDEVLQGRADVALNDVPTVPQYARAHPDKVKALWLDNPPSRVGGGFITRKEDVALRDFLNAATQIAIADGTLVRIDKQWKAFGFIPTLSTVPGQGLVQP